MDRIWQDSDFHKDKKHKIHIIGIYGKPKSFCLMGRNHNLSFNFTFRKCLSTDFGSIKKIIFIIGGVGKNSGNNPFFIGRHYQRAQQTLERSMGSACEIIIRGFEIVPNGNYRPRKTNNYAHEKESTAQNKERSSVHCKLDIIGLMGRL